MSLEFEQARFFRDGAKELVELFVQHFPSVRPIRKVTDADRINHAAAYQKFVTGERKMSEAKGLGEAVKDFKDTLTGIVNKAKDKVNVANAQAAAVGGAVEQFAEGVLADLREVNDIIAQSTNNPPSGADEPAPKKKGLF